MRATIEQVRRVLTYLIIITLPVMTYINLFGKIKVNVSLSDIFIPIFVITYVIDYKHFSLKRNFPYWWYFSGLILITIVSNTNAVWSGNIISGGYLNTINEIVKFIISGLYLFVGINSFSHEEDHLGILRIWTCTAALVSVIGIIVTINLYMGNTINDGLFIHSDIGAKRLLSTLTDPNLAAAYLNLSFWLGLLLFNKAEKRVDKYIGIAGLVLIFIGILLTQSRSGLIALTVGICIYVFTKLKGFIKYVPIIIPIAVIVYFGVLDIDASYFNKSLYNSITERFEYVTEGTGEWETRANLSKAAYMMGLDHPVIGVGRGNFTNNSKEYYEKIGIDTKAPSYENEYGIKIPHNTYATFFAEFGIVGLIIFLIIFYNAIKISLVNKNYIALALLITYIVQAYAVNLENFRGIWVLIPLSLLSYSTSFVGSNMKVAHRSEVYSKKAIAYTILLFIIAVVIYLDAAPRYSKPIDLGTKAIISTIDTKADGDFILRYYINGHTDNNEPSTIIRIFSENEDEQTNLLEEIKHWNPRGYVNLPIKAPTDSKKITVSVALGSKKGSSTVKDVLLVAKSSGQAKRAFIDSIYVPNLVEKYVRGTAFYKRNVVQNVESYKLFADSFIEDSIKSPKIMDQNQKALYFNGDAAINISDKILFLGAKQEVIDSGRVKLFLKFKCIGKMDIDYNIWMHALPIDKEILPEKLKKYGFDNWDHPLVTKTSEWEVGSIYTDEFVVNAKPGQYYVNFGLWNYKWKDGNTYRLDPIIELGNIYLK